MAPLIRLTPAIRDDFVAYLDGELDEQAAERIETVLAQSHVARNDIRRLTQVYELLDVLPRYSASQELTEETLAAVRSGQRHPEARVPEWLRSQRSHLKTVGWGTALVVVVVLSFLTTHRWIPSRTDVLVRDLPVIEQLDVYAETGSIEFLELLSRQEPLLREMATPKRDHEAGQ